MIVARTRLGLVRVGLEVSISKAEPTGETK